MTSRKQKKPKGAAAHVGRGVRTAPRSSSFDAAPGLPRWWLLAMAAIVTLAGVWAYSTSFRGVLVLDDIRAIARNGTFRSFSSALAPAGESTVAGRPVANLSLALNYALAPGDVRDAFVAGPAGDSSSPEAVRRNLWGYHLLNLLVHLAAGLALLGVLRRTFASPRLRAVIDGAAEWPPALDTARSAPGARHPPLLPVPPSAWLAFAASLLWVVHPLQTEAVTYLVQRVEALMSVFYLLTLYCAIRAWEPRGRGWWTGAAVGACGLGMATKEVMVTAPLVVVLWDWLFAGAAQGSWTAIVRRRFALYAGLCAAWIVLALLVWNEHRGPSVQLEQATALRYLATQAAVVTHYLRLAFVPSPLVLLYTWPLVPSFAAVAPQAAFMAALIVLTVFGVVRRHPLSMAGAWILLVLAPTSSLLPIVTEVAAEHRMYLPLAGMTALVMALPFLAWRRWGQRLVPGRQVGRAAAAGFAVAVLGIVLVLAEATRDRNRDYWSDEALWRDAVEKQPDNQRARVAYGVALYGQRRLAEAEAQLREAVRLFPDDPVALGRLGGVLAARGKTQEAVATLRRTAALTARRDAQVLMMLSAAEAQAERFADAAATASEGEQVARSQGRSALADELARRAAQFASMSRRW